MTKLPEIRQPLTQSTSEELRIINEAAAAAAAENRALGIPEFFDRNGVLTFRYPDGRETTEWPTEVLGPDPRRGGR